MMNETFEAFNKKAIFDLKRNMTKLNIGYSDNLLRNMDLWAENKKWIWEEFIKSENYIGDGRIKINATRKIPIDVDTLKNISSLPTARIIINEWIAKDDWDENNSYFADGRKKSKVFLKELKERLEVKNREHNTNVNKVNGKEEAIIGDAFKTEINEEIIMSINPVDYINMSMGENWKSCACLDNYARLLKIEMDYGNQATCGTGGIFSYLIDKSTIVIYRKGKIDTAGIGIERKIWRMLMHTNKKMTKFIFARMYPQQDDRLSNELKSMVIDKICDEIKKIKNYKEYNLYAKRYIKSNYDILDDSINSLYLMYKRNGYQYNDLGSDYGNTKNVIIAIEKEHIQEFDTIEIGEAPYGLYSERQGTDFDYYFSNGILIKMMDENGKEYKVLTYGNPQRTITDVVKTYKGNYGEYASRENCIHLNGEWVNKNDLTGTNAGSVYGKEQVKIIMLNGRERRVSETFIKNAGNRLIGMFIDNKYVYMLKNNIDFNTVFELNGKYYDRKNYIKIYNTAIHRAQLGNHFYIDKDGDICYAGRIDKKDKIYTLGLFVSQQQFIKNTNDDSVVKPIIYNNKFYTGTRDALKQYVIDLSNNGDLERKLIIDSRNKKKLMEVA